MLKNSSHLSKVHKDIFKYYQKALVDTIGQRSGVYALYKENAMGKLSLYYVGKAKDLKSRLNQHLKNQHSGQWHRFSFFSIKNQKHINDIEALVLHVLSPQGNIQTPRRGGSLLRLLKYNITNMQKQRSEGMFYKVARKKRASAAYASKSTRSATKKSARKSSKKRGVQSLKGIGPKRLRARYKGKEFKAQLMYSGKVRY